MVIPSSPDTLSEQLLLIPKNEIKACELLRIEPLDQNTATIKFATVIPTIRIASGMNKPRDTTKGR